MDNIISIQKLRREKEIQQSAFIVEQVEAIRNYIDRYVNIREKVKAKYIFSEIVGCGHTHIFSKMEEQLFLDWFTYDYITIKGMTMYQTYAEHGPRMPHPLNSVVHALFMASVLEPFKVIKSEENHIVAKKLLSGEQCTIKLMDIEKKFDNHVIFLRSIPVLDQVLCISDIFVVHDETLVHYLADQIVKSAGSWRTFLKKYAIKYCWNKT
jgi:hypothetical protein